MQKGESENAKKRRKRNPIKLCLPGGYRYCGPGCSGPGAPINYVDSCCRRHDQCVETYGSCRYCDEKLLHCVQSKSRERTQEGKTARLISDFMRFRLEINGGWRGRRL
ncbi:Parvovirus coat protein VP1-like protein [Niallia circulans]|nr:Parvovirus coat protein VP1-like protein [Niallia circulans]